MVPARSNGSAIRGRRRWAFSNCFFDEDNWTLEVDGRRVAVETKPLELLRELLVRAGAVVSKDELLDRIWPEVTVVEASLPTAVSKLRRALGDDRRDHAIIETVSGLGYRLAVPVEVEQLPDPRGRRAVDRTGIASRPTGPATSAAAPARRLQWAAAAALVLVALVGLWAWREPSFGPAKFASGPNQRDQITAIRNMDRVAIERMLAAGWDPNVTYDDVGTTAMTWLLNICEWDPQHDRRQMLLIGRSFIDHGLDVFYRNRFGDTAYSIAKADRYCGRDHPVTIMLRRICVDSEGRGGDRCMASYALARGEHFPG